MVDARSGGDIVAVHGHRRVRSAELADGSTVPCDLVVTATGWTAPTALLNMSGGRPVYDQRAARFFPAELPEAVLATGGIAGDGSRDQLIEHGRAIGREAARRAGRIRRDWQAALPGRAVLDELALPGRTVLDEPPGRPTARPAGLRPERPNPCWSRTCRSMLTRSCSAAARTGSWTSAKTCRPRTSPPRSGRATTRSSWRSGTPPRRWARPRASSNSSTPSRSRRRQPGSTIAETGTTTWRPPYAPVTLGALAGRELEPVRYSPMQPWHEAHQARPLLAGAWVRPDHYGDPAAEVHQRPGTGRHHRRHPDRQA